MSRTCISQVKKSPIKANTKKDTPITVSVLAVQTEAVGGGQCKWTHPHEHATAWPFTGTSCPPWKLLVLLVLLNRGPVKLLCILTLQTLMLPVLPAPPFSEAIISGIRESWNVITTVSVKRPANHQLWHLFGVILIATKCNWLAVQCDTSQIKSHQEMQNWSPLTCSGSPCTETAINT